MLVTVTTFELLLIFLIGYILSSLVTVLSLLDDDKRNALVYIHTAVLITVTPIVWFVIVQVLK